MPAALRLLLPLLPLAAAARLGGRPALPLAGAGALLVLFLGAVRALTRRGALRDGRGEREPGLHLSLRLLDGSAWLVALVFAAQAVAPRLPDRRLPAGVAVLGAGLLALRALAEGRRRRVPPPRGEERHWLFGLLYLNPRDREVVVPARLGPGYTLNLGRPLSWIVLGLSLAGPVAAGLWLGRRG